MTPSKFTFRTTGGPYRYELPDRTYAPMAKISEVPVFRTAAGHGVSVGETSDGKWVLIHDLLACGHDLPAVPMPRFDKMAEALLYAKFLAVSWRKEDELQS